LVSTIRGETRVEITSRDIVGELKTLSRIGKGLILSFLITGVGIASAAFRINHYDAESIWSLVVCGVLFIWLTLLLRKR
jgi:hypothetical protein